ncbi:MAG: CotH kinase family protein, partial [Planctomycetes bacterium]|nr:CotH kinase family protein [Planctomycetota bacterium]
TYIFPDDIVVQDAAATIARGFPRNWGGTSADYGMDPDVIGQGGRDRFGGRYAETIRDDLLAIPTISVVMNIDELFGSRGIYTNSGSRGRAWERRSSIELIDPAGEEGFQINCGIRIQGGAFRSHGLTKKHSLRFLFRESYGESKLRYPFFGDEATDRLDTIVLRANSNDGWQWSGAGDDPLYIRDSFGRETVLAMGNAASHERFLHVYINGVYWGLYNAVERPDHAFSATYFGGEKEDWDAYSNGSTTNGNTQAWNTMLNLARQGLEADAAYQRIQGRNPDGSENPNLPQYVDVDNIIDYMITNLYVGNTDWPHKNYWVGFNPAEPSGFKYYMWDSEWSMGLRSDLGTNRVNVNNGVAEVYGRLRANPEFRVRFGDRLHQYFSSDGALYVDPDNQGWDPEHPERNRPAERFMRLANTIDRAVVAESARWGDQHSGTPYTRDAHWVRERDNILNNYLPRRSETVLNQFRGARLYPSVPAPALNRRGGFI